MTPITQIVLVGHCSFDAASLRHAASRVPGVQAVHIVNDHPSLATYADNRSLLLINRVLDGRFDVDHGIELIEQLRNRENPPRMMLISDYPDAQAKAQQAGALPGFGKSMTHSPQTAEKLLNAVRN